MGFISSRAGLGTNARHASLGPEGGVGSDRSREAGLGAHARHSALRVNLMMLVLDPMLVKGCSLCSCSLCCSLFSCSSRVARDACFGVHVVRVMLVLLFMLLVLVLVFIS